MTSSTVLPTSTTDPPAGAAAVPVAASADTVTAVYDGVRWTHCEAFRRLFASAPAATWANPAQQGWQRVKQNARREVWRGDLWGVSFYVKYSFTSRWRQAATRLVRPCPARTEFEGGVYAVRAGIPTVPPIAWTDDLRRGRRRCAVLITEAIEPVQALDEFWLALQSDDDACRRCEDATRLTEQLAQMIARAHQAGFEHVDMHAANILVHRYAPRRYQTLFVDLYSARRGVPISDAAVVRNLAQLNQWFRRHSTIGQRLRFLRAYLRWRNEYEDLGAYSRPLDAGFATLVAALTRAARRHAQRLGTQRDHRVAKDGRYFGRINFGGGWRGMGVLRCKHPRAESRASQLVFDVDWWRQQFSDPLRWFADEGDEAAACKTSHSGLVRRALFEHPDGPVPVIIKRPRARNWKRQVAQWLSASRSVRGWRVGHALLHRDVATARPLAVLERRIGPVVFDSLLVTEAIPGAMDLEAFLARKHEELSPTAWHRFKRMLADELAMLVRRLHERGFHHRDCKASNILVVEHPELKLLWIDMDGLRKARFESVSRNLHPLMRLHVSLLELPGLTTTDRVRFLRRYFARFGASPSQWRTVWPRLRRASEKKLRTVAARREWKRRHYGRE